MRSSASPSVQPPERPAPSGPTSPLDGGSFERLFRECAGDVHGYLASLLRDAAMAEDVTAIAFERLYRSRSRLDANRGTPRGWLFAIARNAALDELRRRRREGLRDALLEPSELRTAGADAESLERRASVRDALAALPLRERELVLLKFHGQLSNGEIARALGISESNAGTRLHRALSRLREICEAPVGEEEVA